MKLSEAIRLGAMMGPQLVGRYVADGGGSCALGSAMKAAGLRDGALSFDCDEAWPWCVESKRSCPQVCCGVQHDVTGLIIHLNDNHGWSREQIADWVATIEPAEVHASETIREVQLGQGPLMPPLEEETFETITK